MTPRSARHSVSFLVAVDPSKRWKLGAVTRLGDEDRVRKLDPARVSEYQAATAYADQARERAQRERDPVARALLLGVAEGLPVKPLARKMGLAPMTAYDRLRRAMG